MRLPWVAIATLLMVIGPAAAEETDWAAAMAEARWDWRPGDLIFLNGVNELDELFRQVEGGEWASVGVLRPSSGGPRVVYADAAAGVTEVMLYEIEDARGPADYAVYRLKAEATDRPAGDIGLGC